MYFYMSEDLNGGQGEQPLMSSQFIHPIMSPVRANLQFTPGLHRHTNVGLSLNISYQKAATETTEILYFVLLDGVNVSS